MQKKNLWTLVGVIAALVVILGAYALFHKSNKSTTPPTINTPATSTQSQPAVNNAVLKTASAASVGQYLTDPSGRALYTYGGDTSGTSNCSGSCVTSWPPYKDTGSTTGLPTNVSTIKRSDDSSNQYTYKGLPLYYFSGDSSGQVTGDGVSSFRVAKP